MEIRRSLPCDANEICLMEAEYFTDPWGEKDILSYICSDDGMCYSALDEGVLIGYIIGRKIVPEGEIYRVAVRLDRRLRGVGYRLLSYALKTEGGKGVETVFLEVRSRNIGARRLYSSYGFKEISIRKNYYKDPSDDAVIMVK